ncbi:MULTISPECIES: TetR/AcrR family transcriptional regulator [Streptomyces]|uniref:TetR/AcrR family transcriptional regulator n=1 Tax=Streptomyces gilvifuscus TaxID=1550617 RepID=A0ABT5FZY0_9ACTN|nr:MULTISPECIES: TetR/AcrR family transcriptional regulator [Streptomyces]MBK3646514.1 TetR/AcrR family transcriptional regulator [Streptomyces sp. MBT33]MDC2958102.1 TetR/AcrR family transcriptional regulator [Streptomyces gilvifuscus]
MPTVTWTRLSPARRERVLVAAMDQFGTHGYSTGSLNVIAREAGVAKGSLFQYFSGKLDLFAYVAEQTSLRIYAHMRPWLDGYDGSVHFSTHLIDALEAWLDYFAGQPLERGVTAATNMEMDPTVREAVRVPVNAIYLAGLRPLLERAVAAGDLSKEADLDALLTMLLLLLPHLALVSHVPGLDGPLALTGVHPEVRRENLSRLITPLLAAFTVKDES